MSNVQKSTDSIQELFANLTDNVAKVLEHPNTPRYVSDTLREAIDEIANHYYLDDDPPAARTRQVIPRLGQRIDQDNNLKV